LVGPGRPRGGDFDALAVLEAIVRRAALPLDGHQPGGDELLHVSPGVAAELHRDELIEPRALDVGDEHFFLFHRLLTHCRAMAAPPATTQTKPIHCDTQSPANDQPRSSPRANS